MNDKTKNKPEKTKTLIGNWVKPSLIIVGKLTEIVQGGGGSKHDGDTGNKDAPKQTGPFG